MNNENAEREGAAPLCGGGLTWGGDAVPVPWHVVVQGEEHHPHGQGEHPRQETVEDQVEQQDEGWRVSEEWRHGEGEKGFIFNEVQA